MAGRAASALALCAALWAGPAAAQLVGHQCRQEARLGDGWVSVSIYRPRQGPTDVQIAWTPRPRPAGAVVGLSEIRIDFARPPAGGPVARPARLAVEYGVARPRTALWVMVRWGEAFQREAIFLPAARRRGPPAAGYVRTLVLEGPAVAEAFAADRPLEVYLVEGSGRVRASHVERLPRRGEALQAMDRLWAELGPKAADAERLCEPLEIIESP